MFLKIKWFLKVLWYNNKGSIVCVKGGLGLIVYIFNWIFLFEIEKC